MLSGQGNGGQGKASKARGLCPLDPHQGLSPWNHWGLRQEGGATLPLDGSVSRPLLGEAVRGVQGTSPLAEGPGGQRPPGLAFFPCPPLPLRVRIRP